MSILSTKKQSETEFLADLKARQVYAQSVYHDQSASKHSISETQANVNSDSKNNLPSGREWIALDYCVKA